MGMTPRVNCTCGLGAEVPHESVARWVEAVAGGATKSPSPFTLHCVGIEASRLRACPASQQPPAEARPEGEEPCVRDPFPLEPDDDGTLRCGICKSAIEARCPKCDAAPKCKACGGSGLVRGDGLPPHPEPCPECGPQTEDDILAMPIEQVHAELAARGIDTEPTKRLVRALLEMRAWKARAEALEKREAVLLSALDQIRLRPVGTSAAKSVRMADMALAKVSEIEVPAPRSGSLAAENGTYSPLVPKGGVIGAPSSSNACPYCKITAAEIAVEGKHRKGCPLRNARPVGAEETK